MVFPYTSLTAACNFSASSNFQLSETCLNNEVPPVFINSNGQNCSRPNMSYNADFQVSNSHCNETTDSIGSGQNTTTDMNYDPNNSQNFSFSSNVLGNLQNWNGKRSNYFSYKLNDMKQFYNQEIPLVDNSVPIYTNGPNMNSDNGYYSFPNILDTEIDHIQPASCNIFPACMNINLSMKMNVDLEAAYTRHEKYSPRYHMSPFCQNYPLSPMDIHKPSQYRQMNTIDSFPYSFSHNQYSESELNSFMNSNNAGLIDERAMSQLYNYGHIDNYRIRIHPGTNSNTPLFKYPNMGNLVKEGSQRDLKLLASHLYLDEPNQCHLCGRSYARPSTLKIHMRTHSGERPFKCNVCSKTFSQVANLTAHKRIHSGEKPFSCHICCRTFSQSSSVTTHMRTHSGERPYRCHHCSKAFSDSSTLTKHTRVHSGEKPYKCRICLLKFSQSGNLNRHMRVHLNSINSSAE